MFTNVLIQYSKKLQMPKTKIEVNSRDATAQVTSAVHTSEPGIHMTDCVTLTFSSYYPYSLCTQTIYVQLISTTS